VELLDELDAPTANDPHVWLDPVLYGRLVDRVARALADADPGCRDRIDRNAARLQGEIDDVAAAYADGLRDCERRTIVTAHDAFGHLARRYDLRQESIAGIAPDEEPNAARLADLADVVREQGVTTIFTEELVSRRVADALAREAGGVRTATLNPLEGLTPDEVDAGDDWASVMRSNLRRLRNALDCA
jgi:zinc transport system substrate-binding protein